MDSGCYGQEYSKLNDAQKREQVKFFIDRYMEKAWSGKPVMTENARNCIESMYFVARDEDLSIGEDRYNACVVLAELSARFRFSPTVEYEDAARAADIVFPDPEEEKKEF